MMNTEIATHEIDAHVAYGEFLESAEGQRALSLMGAHKMSLREVLVAVEAAILDVHPVLMPGTLYSTEELCGPDLWSLLRFDGARRAAGLCMAFLVKSDAVPLVERLTPSGKGQKRYLLDSLRAGTTPFDGDVFS